MSLIGGCGAIFALIKKWPHKIYHHAIVFHVSGSWGCVTLGCFVFMDDRYDDENTLKHECIGHVRQNAILGPLFPFVIALPSLIHAALHNKYCSDPNYYHFYTEAWANKLAGLLPTL